MRIATGCISRENHGGGACGVCAGCVDKSRTNQQTLSLFRSMSVKRALSQYPLPLPVKRRRKLEEPVRTDFHLALARNESWAQISLALSSITPNSYLAARQLSELMEHSYRLWEVAGITNIIASFLGQWDVTRHFNIVANGSRAPSEDINWVVERKTGNDMIGLLNAEEQKQWRETLFLTRGEEQCTHNCGSLHCKLRISLSLHSTAYKVLLVGLYQEALRIYTANYSAVRALHWSHLINTHSIENGRVILDFDTSTAVGRSVLEEMQFLCRLKLAYDCLPHMWDFSFPEWLPHLENMEPYIALMRCVRGWEDDMGNFIRLDTEERDLFRGLIHMKQGYTDFGEGTVTYLTGFSDFIRGYFN